MISIDAQPELFVKPWRDPVVDRYGFEAHSEYVERFWAPLIGPSSLFLLRFLASQLNDAPDGFVLPCARTAQYLGMSDKTGPGDVFPRTLNRLCQFRIAHEMDGALFVRQKIASLHPKQVVRLAQPLQQLHQDYLQQRMADRGKATEPSSRDLVGQERAS